MKSCRFVIIAVCASVIFSFTYGVLSAHYQIFPYGLMKATWLLVEHEDVRLMKRKRSITRKNTIYYKTRVSLFEKLRANDYDIVFVGDSLTDRAEWQASFPMIKIANRGISGDSTRGISERLDSIFSTSASTAFVMMGVNDLMAGIAVNKVFDNYQDIVSELADHGLTVYIQSTILSGNPKKNSRSLNDKILALNVRLQKLANETKSVFFIDLNAVLAPGLMLNEAYTLDGIHLNGNGYVKWNELIQPYLTRYASVRTG